MDTKQLGAEICRLRDEDGITFAEVGRKSGYSASAISQFVHHGKTSVELEESLKELLMEHYGYTKEIEGYNDNIELFPTKEFKEILGFCEDMRVRQKMGVVIGHPGSGKTTAVKEYVSRTEGALYIEACENMRMSDLLEIIASACGIELKRGSDYKKMQQIIGALVVKKLIIIIDEAEYLKKWDVSKFEILRKIWDNTKTPIIFCGTPELEMILTRGNGKDNLAQLYRRKYMMRLEGIKEKEIREILKKYNTNSRAKDLLTAVAIDVKHGGLGNFIEILELCLEAATGGEITENIVKEAMKYKMLY